MSIPRATYRLQANPDLGFAQIHRLVNYLDRLGTSDLYTSPLSAARPGSLHGYDVIDPTRLSPELGTQADFDALVEELHRRNMGILLDIVPNHMVAGHENPWWWDVLANGQASPWAGYFDIDWSRHGGKLLLPVLAKPLPDVLDRGELTVETDERGRHLRYYDMRFPLIGDVEAPDIGRTLADQHYILAYWSDGRAQLNYRRFFEIDSLVGVRVEDPEVFEATHALVRHLIERHAVSGLRVDHIDGLYDPAQFLDRLRALAPDAYLLVEKVLAGDEWLPEAWPVDGTTGYEFLNAVNGLFVDPAGLRALQAGYAEFTGRSASFPDVVFGAKRQVARELFPSELAALIRDLHALAPDVDQVGLSDAIATVAAAFPVYRTYVDAAGVTEDDRTVIEHGVADARRHAGPAPAIDLLARVLLLDVPIAQREGCLRFVMRWQQFTGPLAAKGLEDTALYRYNALLSMNDVGADPSGPRPTSPGAFHAFNQQRLARSPHTLNATATHDTKRGEDVRARLNVLSELAEEWANRQLRWSELSGRLKTTLDRRPTPDPNDETLVYQTLLGAWPLNAAELPSFRERVGTYLVKAAREAKERTSWLEPNDAYERALTGFADALFDSAPFFDDFLPFQHRVAELAVTNSLAQTLLKIASPGVPDTYQGTELWDLHLVDPDNRRPVDFATRTELLNQLTNSEPSPQLAAELLANWRDGRVKLHVIARALGFRRAKAALFAEGDYLPLEVTGTHADRVLAFVRRHRDAWALVIVPRLVANLDSPPLGNVWRDTAVALPDDAPGRWSNVLTGETVAAADSTLTGAKAFEHLPVALLTG